MMICNAVQMGPGWCGTGLCSDHDGVQPDVVVLSKALLGDVLLVAVALTDDEVMLPARPG